MSTHNYAGMQHPQFGMSARSVLLEAGLAWSAGGMPVDGVLLHRRYSERVACATPGGTAVTSQMLDVSVHERRRERRMQDPEYRAAYERAAREIGQTDAVIRQLDALRVDLGISKAELARRVNRNASRVRRPVTSRQVGPELPLIVAPAESPRAAGRVVPRTSQ